MIKICYIINSLKPCGPVNVLYSMIHGIDKNKYNVTVLTLIDENECDIVDMFKKEKISIIELNYRKNPFTLLKYKSISKIIDKHNFDIIHIHGHVTAFLTHKTKAKKVITIHNKLLEDFKGTYGKILGYIITKIYLRIISKFDKVVCCSESSYNKCKSSIKECTFVRNGIFIDDEIFQNKEAIRDKMRKHLNIPKDAIVYIYAGNFNDNKNVICMLDFFSKTLKENEYLITLGIGPLYDHALEYSSENIIQCGFKKNVLDYMLSSDIYVSFSKTEGFPISLIEALYCDLKLLISDIDSHNECIKIDSKYNIGLVFNNDDFDDFVEKKEKIIENLSNKESHSFQQKHLTCYRMMKEYQKIYDEL